MSKKDRIAIVFSLIPVMFAILSFALAQNDEDRIIGFFIMVGIAIYWGYRFIKNDISFLNTKEDK